MAQVLPEAGELVWRRLRSPRYLAKRGVNCVRGMTVLRRPARAQFLASGDESGTAPEDRRFRPDIQGLRAVAVLLVVLFHAVGRPFSGGYVGVDVFFVISGFVITGVLLRERASSGRTSVLAFYGRRCRRIIPAATLVILVTIAASYLVLGFLAGDSTARDGRWAAVFLVNFHFASMATNYLAAQQPPSPLQNFWSLSVEEQFYVVYPTLFLALAAVRTRISFRLRTAIGLIIIIIVSFALSISQTQTNEAVAYFSPFTRAWELALGALIAVSTNRLLRLRPHVAAAMGWLGLGAILLSAIVFNAQTPYPGSLVAVPVVGAGFVIAGGVVAPNFGVERMLALAPFQWLGKLSYSLYLWHWPILIIAAEKQERTNLPVRQGLLLLALALGASVVSYALVENSKPLGQHRSWRWADSPDDHICDGRPTHSGKLRRLAVIACQGRSRCGCTGQRPDQRIDADSANPSRSHPFVTNHRLRLGGSSSKLSASSGGG
jgi:peptidoglycan/LPS O-acetylase OafA/YrhL